MKKIIVGFILVLCILLVPWAGHAGTYWNFGFGSSSYSYGGYYGSSCVTYWPVVPVVPYGCTKNFVIGSPCCAPRPRRCYRPYHAWHRGYYHPRRYYYGGAYHPAPPPVHYRARHYWPNRRWHHPCNCTINLGRGRRRR